LKGLRLVLLLWERLKEEIQVLYGSHSLMDLLEGVEENKV
jgi:hypothetical protein